VLLPVAIVFIFARVLESRTTSCRVRIRALPWEKGIGREISSCRGTSGVYFLEYLSPFGNSRAPSETYAAWGKPNKSTLTFNGRSFTTSPRPSASLVAGRRCAYASAATAVGRALAATLWRYTTFVRLGVVLGPKLIALPNRCR